MPEPERSDGELVVHAETAASHRAAPPATAAWKQDSESFLTGRKALISTLISLALSPFAILTGYYFGKILEAPRLKIQHVRAEAEREPLKLHTDALTPIHRDYGMFKAVSGQMPPTCQDWIAKGEIAKPCISESIKIVGQMTDGLTFEGKTTTENIATIQAWTPDKELVLYPVVIPGADIQRLTELARMDKMRAVEILRGFLKAVEVRRTALAGLADELRRLEREQTTPRTGKVRFYVGVLNTGDADGVVFPDAMLNVIESKVALVRKNSPDDADGTYTVVRAHSFEELTFEVNDAKTEKGVLDRWRGLIQKEAQEKFSIALKSPNEFSADSRLP
jgi:hypothetical protein